MQISLLGPLAVEHDGTELDPGGGKQATVLTALTLGRGRVVATDRLVDLVWGDNPPSKPHVTLRSYISHLRRIIEPEKGPGDRARLRWSFPGSHTPAEFTLRLVEQRFEVSHSGRSGSPAVDVEELRSFPVLTDPGGSRGEAELVVPEDAASSVEQAYHAHRWTLVLEAGWRLREDYVLWVQ